MPKDFATECARRFFTEGQGDFRAVTYNRLCLVMRSDGGELEIRPARPISKELAVHSLSEVDDGVLLPSASNLKGLVDRPLVWKVRLKSPPKRDLEYFFMRSSFDPDDLDARHNIIDYRATTPRNTHFQQAIEVELVVREDGTATPKFVYGRNAQSPGVTVEGRPFHIDMTFASEDAGGSTYLGFDFGTSASSCSFVDSKDVHLIEGRNRIPEWREISELLVDLPYPVAVPLARFISEIDPHRREEKGRAAAEALLTFAAYVAYMDHCSVGGSKSSFFKNLAHRSAGPLWALLRNCLNASSTKLTFAAPLLPLVKRETSEQIDEWVSGLASGKHDRQGFVDWMSFLKLLANHVAIVLQANCFGVFEGVTAKRFQHGRYNGIFRILNGPSQTFVHVLEYQGGEPFSDERVYLVNTESRSALCLSSSLLLGPERDSRRYGRAGYVRIRHSEGSCLRIQVHSAIAGSQYRCRR